MATEGGGAAPEPSKEPTASGTPSPGKKHAAKTRRLLPMELRKRRRAAKLLAAAQKKSRVSLASTPSAPKPIKPASEEAASEGETQQKAGSSDAVEETKEGGSPAETSMVTPGKQKSPLGAAVTITRLSSLYSSSLLTQQRQRRRIIPGANVPSTFHVQDLPLDVVPKTKLSILTAYPYPFQRTNSQVKKEALQNFIAGNGSSAEGSVHHRAAVRWQEALHYFVHPADSVPTSILLNRVTAATTSEPLLGGPKGERKREEKAFFTARWNTWQEAFRDAYMNFRRQTSAGSNSQAPDNSFYLRSSEFVVCFLLDTGSQGTMDEEAPDSIISLCRQHDDEAELAATRPEGTKHTKKRRLCAVMSQSNARIRKVLHHLNVEYTMPYVNANQTQREVGEFHLLEEELEATRSTGKEKHGGGLIAPVTRSASTQENIHGMDSLLLFHGHNAVHGLYEFLVNRPPMSNQDVPELYALHPFTNASIQSLHVTSFGRVGGPATDPLSEDQPSRAAALFRTEIVGFCFPSSVVKLLAVLKDEWEASKSSYGSFEAADTEVTNTEKQDAPIALRTYMEAVAGAERLNAVKLDEEVTNGPGEKHVEQEERQKRLQELAFSKRRMEIVVVTKTEDRYAVETSTQALVARR